MIFGTSALLFGAANCRSTSLVLHFGTLGDHLGTLGEPWEAIDAAEGHLGVRNRIFIDLRWIWGPRVFKFFQFFGRHWCLLFMLVSRCRFLMIFWFGSRGVRPGNNHLARICMQKQFATHVGSPWIL